MFILPMEMCRLIYFWIKWVERQPSFFIPKNAFVFVYLNSFACDCQVNTNTKIFIVQEKNNLIKYLLQTFWPFANLVHHFLAKEKRKIWKKKQ